MESLDVKNFCLVILGKQNDVKKELEFISEGTINCVEGKHLFIATFKSTLFAKDIEIFLSSSGINYILSEMVSSLFSADLGEFNPILFNLNQNVNIFEKKIIIPFTEGEDAVIVDEEEENLTLDELLDLISEKGFEQLTNKQKEMLNQFSQNK